MFSSYQNTSCFSGDCTMCSDCFGQGENSYTFPEHPEQPPLQETNWEKYKVMLERSDEYRTATKAQEQERIGTGSLDWRDNRWPLQSEMFALRALGVPLQGSIRLEEGYLFQADNFNIMDNLSKEEYKESIDKFPGYRDKMDKLMKSYGYEYPELSGSIPKHYDLLEGRYTLIEETGGQMCDEPECTMIGHCMIKQDEVIMKHAGLVDYYSDYYATLPIYTRNKDHELCALCISN